MILLGGEIDYTHLPDVIRLFIQTGSHPENVHAFVTRQADKQAAYEAGRGQVERWAYPLGPKL